jgi:cytochrome c biogenesis protein CcmG, thiol:disulfide interchange protein DsbE
MSEQAPRRIAPIIAVAIAVVMVFFIVIFATTSNDKAGTATTPLLLKPAPEISSTTYDGDLFLLSRRRGSWVVLNFFNSTCVPCKREHPELVKFFKTQEALDGTGAELYTIVNDDDEQAVRDFFDKSGGGWPIIRDEDANISVDESSQYENEALVKLVRDVVLRCRIDDLWYSTRFGTSDSTGTN